MQRVCVCDVCVCAKLPIKEDQANRGNTFSAQIEVETVTVSIGWAYVVYIVVLYHPDTLVQTRS